MWLEVDGQRFQDGSTGTMVYRGRVPGQLPEPVHEPAAGRRDLDRHAARRRHGQKPPVYPAPGQPVRLGIEGLGEQEQLVSELERAGLGSEGNRSRSAREVTAPSSRHRNSIRQDGRDNEDRVIGLGRMGAALATRLQGCGHELVVWNRTPDKAKALVEAGAALADRPADVVSRSEAMITCLLDARRWRRSSEATVASSPRDVNGKLFIEMSTVQPKTQRALAERVSAKGGAYVECPVSGSTGPAREGRLIGFAGGRPGGCEPAHVRSLSSSAAGLNMLDPSDQGRA